MLNAIDLEERFKKTLPMLTRQIEGLKLLQKTRKPRPDDEKRVGLSGLSIHSPSHHLHLLPTDDLSPVTALSCRYWLSVKAACSPAGSSLLRRKVRMRMAMTWPCWRGRWTRQQCPSLLYVYAWKNSSGMYGPSTSVSASRQFVYDMIWYVLYTLTGVREV